jgi:hypothetical protein
LTELDDFCFQTGNGDFLMLWNAMQTIICGGTTNVTNGGDISEHSSGVTIGTKVVVVEYNFVNI